MIEASAQLKTLLAGSTEFLMADLYTIQVKNGYILRYTSADIDSGAFSSGMLIKRDSVRHCRGLESDDLVVTFYPSPTDHIGPIPFLQAVAKGALDGADFLLERAFYSPDWNTMVGKIVRFQGVVSEINGMSRTEIPITVKSTLELLNIQMPRNVYQPGCRRALFDVGCSLNKADYGVATQCLSGSTAKELHVSISQIDGWADLGTVIFTSGNNTGISRTVKTHASGVITFSLSFPYAPALFDEITIYAGCDKQMATCHDKFNNLINFSGEPYVPAAETAY